MKKQNGYSTVEYLVGAGVVAAIALAAFIYTLLPAADAVEEHQPDTYYSDYYRADES
ncbi:hypothetical protein [Lentibacillus salinarum]|uniref:Class III signal peptide-containing protein n=1 Tax=Lentibacillus salinarum TaxID=446820 RepID=A0ABW3ZYZ0_9BACI